MKAASSQLKTFLASCTSHARVHLLTITFANGTIGRFSDAGQEIKYAGQTYYPLDFKLQGISQSIGFNVDAVEIDIASKISDQSGGVYLGKLALNGGLRGALVTLDRLFAQDFATFYSAGPIGGVQMFSGRVSELPEGGETEFTLRVTSWAELLDAQFPNDVYTPSCKATLFDSRCGLSKAAFQAAGSVIAGAISKLQFPTGLVAAADYYSLGYMEFTSGPNAGIKRTIRSHAGTGVLTLAAPLPYLPVVGNGFNIWAGCNKSFAHCATKFNNGKMRGEPWIPLPETAV